MSLTYKTTQVTEKITEHTITVPKHFSMFTPQGNKRIADLSREFLAVADSDASYVKKIEAALTYLRKWRSMDKYKSYSEAGDTAVRECVGDFLTEFVTPPVWITTRCGSRRKDTRKISVGNKVTHTG